jgi:hypothetical protein
MNRNAIHTLRRRAQVKLVVPRMVTRMQRLLHAFGPLSPTAFAALGARPTATCLEDDFGQASPMVMDTLNFVELLHDALSDLGLDYSFCPAEHFEAAKNQGRWLIVLSNGVMDPGLGQAARAALDDGHAITLGPLFPRYDENLLPYETPLALPNGPAGVPTLVGLNPRAVRGAVEAASAGLHLPRLRLSPKTLSGTLLEDAEGELRVAFVINPSDEDVQAEWEFERRVSATDALTGQVMESGDLTLKLPVQKRSVRMLELRWLS